MTMTKEDALREINRLCDQKGILTSIRPDEFTVGDFAKSRSCSRRSASRILASLEKEGLVSRRIAYSDSGTTVAWRFIGKEMPPPDQPQAPSPKAV
jgi:DNA-binding MarR family transcriptional regulator